MNVTKQLMATKRVFVFLVALFLFKSVVAQNASDLFISEYCEYNQTVSTPQYFNHYIEIYNGTGNTVDLSKYQLWRSLNATGWNNNVGVVVTPLALKGLLANNKTYVITRPDLPTTPISIAADSAQSWSFLNLSGNDAIGLARSDGAGNFSLIDLIGSPTVDPGTNSGWSVAGIANATMNRTMIRKSSVKSPTVDWALSAGTTIADSQWSVLAQNDISSIGIHSFDSAPVIVTQADTLSAFFIGNSYTFYFDLPNIITSLALSSPNKDVFIHEQSTIPSYTLKQHSTTAATLDLLKSRAYDFVVIQENSTYPAKDIATVQTQTFPYAQFFDGLRREYSPCGQTMFYMTWGRKNGEATLCQTIPADCTYDGMDSLISVRYKMMQKDNDALISPVGAVKHYIRKQYPNIELYDADGSHPSAAGAYSAACCFYATMYQKDPAKCTYNFSQYITAADAKIIRDVAKLVVFDSLSTWNTYQSNKCATDLIKIAIQSPLKTDTLIASQIYTAQANIDFTTSSVSEVSFYLNGNFVGSVTSAPFEMQFSSSLIGVNTLRIKVTNSAGKMNSLGVNFVLKANVATKLISYNSKSCRLYPNPALSELNIEISDLALDCANMQIVDMAGHVVVNKQIKTGVNTIEIGNFITGLYTVRIISKENMLIDKFVKL